MSMSVQHLHELVIFLVQQEHPGGTINIVYNKLLILTSIVALILGTLFDVVLLVIHEYTRDTL